MHASPTTGYASSELRQPAARAGFRRPARPTRRRQAIAAQFR